MNLFDVVPLEKVPTTSRPAGLAELKRAQAPLIQAAEVLETTFGRNDDRVNETIRKLHTEITDKSRGYLARYFDENNIIPSVNVPASTSLRSARSSLTEVSATNLVGSYLSRLAQSPRAQLSKLRSLADTLALTIFSVDYLNPKSFGGSYRTESMVNAFSVAAREQGMQPFVMAPIRHYDILRHIDSKDPSTEMYSMHHASAIESLQIMMPALVMMSSAIARLGDNLQTIIKRVDSLESTVKGTVRGLELMDKRLTDLSKKVDQQQEERMLEQIRLKKLEEELARVQAEQASQRRSFDWFAVGDPMVFAIPSSVSVSTGEALAVVGPCWGPEFDNLIVQALDLSHIQGQRADLDSRVSRIWY